MTWQVRKNYIKTKPSGSKVMAASVEVKRYKLFIKLLNKWSLEKNKPNSLEIDEIDKIDFRGHLKRRAELIKSYNCELI